LSRRRRNPQRRRDRRPPHHHRRKSRPCRPAGERKQRHRMATGRAGRRRRPAGILAGARGSPCGTAGRPWRRDRRRHGRDLHRWGGPRSDTVRHEGHLHTLLREPQPFGPRPRPGRDPRRRRSGRVRRLASRSHPWPMVGWDGRTPSAVGPVGRIGDGAVHGCGGLRAPAESPRVTAAVLCRGGARTRLHGLCLCRPCRAKPGAEIVVRPILDVLASALGGLSGATRARQQRDR